MRWWLAASPMLWGCLYLGGINHAPAVVLRLDAPSSLLFLDGTAALVAEAHDAEGDALTYTWSVEVRSLKGERLQVVDAGGQLGAERSARPLPGGDRFSLPLRTRGTYRVELRVRDPRGAEGVAVTEVVVASRPPEPQLQLLPQAEGTFPLGGPYPAHATYLVSAGATTDPDAEDDLTCGKGASIEWKLLEPDPSRLEFFRTRPCTEESGLEILQLRARPVTAALPVRVQATVTDPTGVRGVGSLAFVLAPNRPPCLRVPPEASPVEKILLLYDSVGEQGEGAVQVGAQFPDDDVHEFRYRWLRASRAEGPYLETASQPGPFFTMDRSVGLPGDHVFLRLVVQDAQSAWPSCDAATARCASADGLPPSCYQWITWQVEVR
ncbi:MAG: hypothetical protein IT371_13870 [Deltaproteobacteria bacterium]|nr:hypothetical protein [Deltaproteobacteria bacterium]